MARARLIKPGFFLNEDLAECSPLARVLFAGLWCIADRDGRLKDKPARIKAQTLPYDDCDPDELMGDLAAHGFIIRYTAGGERFVQVVHFSEHQSPHVKEAASVIPAPDEHQTSTGLAPDEHGSSPAVSIAVPIAETVGVSRGRAILPPCLSSPANIAEFPDCSLADALLRAADAHFRWNGGCAKDRDTFVRIFADTCMAGCSATPEQADDCVSLFLVKRDKLGRDFRPAMRLLERMLREDRRPVDD